MFERVESHNDRTASIPDELQETDEEGISTEKDGESWLLEEKRRREQEGRDLKLIIVARDGNTGVGKTTLAVRLAKLWDDEWSADKVSVGDAERFAELYDEVDRGSTIILDEAEEAANARRAMTAENISVVNQWAQRRQWGIASVMTLPSSSQIDNQLRELADVKIICHARPRGKAVVYKYKVGDHSGNIWAERRETIYFDEMDDDEDYQRLAEMKEEMLSVKNDDEDGPAVDPQAMACSLRRNNDDMSPADIAETIPNNPDTSEQYSRRTVRRWLERKDLI